MQKYIEFLESTNIYNLENKIGDVTFNKFNNKFKISFTLACKINHLQRLKELGLKIDFSDKRVGMFYNQNTIGCSGNNISVNCSCDLVVFKVVSNFFRGDFRANMLNDTQLEWANFGTKKKIKTIETIKIDSEKMTKLKNLIKQKVHKRQYSKETYNSILVQRVLNII